MIMTFLFWTLWIINILLLFLAIVGKGFRSGFGAGVDLNSVVIIVLIAVMAGSLVFRYSVKQKWISLVVVSLPLWLMMLWYIFEKISEKSV